MICIPTSSNPAILTQGLDKNTARIPRPYRGSQSTRYVTAVLAKTTSILTSSKYIKKENRHNAHPMSTGKKRENTHSSFTKGAPHHHPPMPPKKAMGAIKQNRRGRPTATP